MTTIIPTPPEAAPRYLGTGLPAELNAQVAPDALTLWADYPYDEPALLAALAALGISPWTVVIYEAVLNAAAVYTHGNIRIPPKLDYTLRWLFCTPDMHRVHHSVVRAETDSNFGFNLSWWDHLFHTYQAQPLLGHEGMTIGLKEFRNPRELRLDRMLLQPFVATQR